MGVASAVFDGIVQNLVPLLSIATAAVCHWVIDWEDEALDATGKLRCEAQRAGHMPHAGVH